MMNDRTNHYPKPLNGSLSPLIPSPDLSLEDLGEGIRADLQALLIQHSEHWQPMGLMAETLNTISGLSAELEDVLRTSQDFTAMEAWLTSGFIPNGDAIAPNHASENIDGTERFYRTETFNRARTETLRGDRTDPPLSDLRSDPIKAAISRTHLHPTPTAPFPPMARDYQGVTPPARPTIPPSQINATDINPTDRQGSPIWGEARNTVDSSEWVETSNRLGDRPHQGNHATAPTQFQPSTPPASDSSPQAAMPMRGLKDFAQLIAPDHPYNAPSASPPTTSSLASPPIATFADLPLVPHPPRQSSPPVPSLDPDATDPFSDGPPLNDPVASRFRRPETATYSAGEMTSDHPLVSDRLQEPQSLSSPHFHPSPPFSQAIAPHRSPSWASPDPSSVSTEFITLPRSPSSPPSSTPSLTEADLDQIMEAIAQSVEQDYQQFYGR